MKAILETRPPVLLESVDGSWRYHYNIIESTMPVSENAEVATFECDTLRIDEPTYENITALLIREMYTLDAELSIQRQRDTKPESFEEYNAFCEAVKAMVKNDLKVQTNDL